MRVQVKGLILLSIMVMQAPGAFAAELSEEQRAQVTETQETHEFQAETGRLMDIIINSLYTQKEIFLREIISNAADALDKLRFMSIQNPELLGNTPQLEIRIEYDPQEKSVTVRDTGIGMTHNDLIQNLGTIAKSGTTQFIEAIKGGNVNLIGQFGVGFYSTFLAGQKVTVVSKNNNDVQQIWESSAAHQYSISPDPRGNTLGRGSEVTVHLKQDAQEFAEEDTIKNLIQKYSEFINFPIYLRTIRTVSKEIPLEDQDAVQDDMVVQSEDSKQHDDLEVKDVVDDDDKDASKDKVKTQVIKEKVLDWILVNDNKAIWTRPKEEITDEEYQKFYSSLTKTQEAPLEWVHFKAEGEVEFTSLIYIPKQAPSNMFDQYYGKTATGLKLYVRRVMINEEFEDLVPRYLNFIRGLIDSDELPLNVNRETLQQLKMLKVISRKIVRKTIDMIQKMSEMDEEDDDEDEDENEDQVDQKVDVEEEKTPEQKKQELDERRQKRVDKFAEFNKHFGKNMKLGVIEDQQNRQRLAKLTRWYSSNNSTELISLDDYIGRVKPGQDSIYYIAGDDKAQLLKSPVIQGLLKQGYEVLLLDDPIDEYCFLHLTEYEKKSLINVGKGDFRTPEEGDSSRRRLKKLKKVFQPLTDWMRKLLADTVDTVSISSRLVNDPIVVVAGEGGSSANMERIVKAQAYSNNVPNQVHKKNVEINPNHPAIKELLERVKEDPDKETEDLAKVLYEAALVNSGFSLQNVDQFAVRFYRLFNSALGISRDAAVEDYEVDLEDEGTAENVKSALDDIDIKQVGADQVDLDGFKTHFGSDDL